MKKVLRISARIFLVAATFLLAVWLLLQTPVFQQWLTQLAARRLSEALHTDVKVKRAYIGWLNRINVEGVLVNDQRKDTLLSVGSLQVNVTDWFLVKDTVVIKYLSLNDVVIKMNRNDTSWNYTFLSQNNKSSADTSTSRKKGRPIVWQLETLSIRRFRMDQEDRWRGKSIYTGMEHLALRCRRFDLPNLAFDFEEVNLNAPLYREVRKSGLWSAADSVAFYRRMDSLDRLRVFPETWNPDGMSLHIDRLQLQNGLVEVFNRRNTAFVPGEFEESDAIFHSISGKLSQVRLNHDTITALADISAKERSGLIVRKLQARYSMHPQLMEFDDLNLEVNDSRLGPYFAMRYRTIDDMEEFIDSVDMTARLSGSRINMADISFFAPDVKGIRQVYTLSGSATGRVSDFQVKGLDLATGKSRLRGDYAMRGLVDIDRTLISFTSTGSDIALEDVAVWAPELRTIKNTPVSRLGVMRYTGSYEGTVYDFKAKGHLATAVGQMDANLTMRLTGPKQGFEGTISNAAINGGKLLEVPGLGNMLFDGTVSSKGISATSPLTIHADIKSMQYRDYTYTGIVSDAVFANEALSASLSATDPNLNANFTTQLDFKTRAQRYNARGAIGHAHLLNLGLSKDSISVSGLFDVNFTGSKIDDFRGYARVYEAELSLKNKQLNFDSLYLESSIDTAGVETLVLQTNEADIRVNGNFNISDLPNAFQQFLNRYYPSIIPAPARRPGNQELTFSVETRNVEPFLFLIDPRLKGLNDTHLLGSLDTRSQELLVNLEMPYLEYGGLQLNNTILRANGSINALNVSGNISSLKLNDSLSFPNAQLLVNTFNDTTRLKINTRTDGPLGNAAVGALIISKPDGFEARFDESSFIVNNKKWTLISDGSLQMKKGYLISNGLQLVNDNQRVSMYTQPSDDGYWNDIYVDVQDLILGDVMPFFMTEPRLEGLVSARIVVQDPLGKPFVNTDFITRDFLFNNDSVGEISGSASFDAATGKLRGEVDSKNPGYDFSGLVRLDFRDTATRQIDLVMDLRNERINILKKYLEDVFDDIDGYASGRLYIRGKLASPQLLGDVQVNNARLLVGYTKCTYLIDSAHLRFGSNYIDFGSISIRDPKGRTGVMEGMMYHRFFDSLSFSMRMRSNEIQLLNTGASDNDLFFGQAVGRANFDLAGPVNNLRMRVTGVTTDTSHIVITNKTGRESGTADFLVFKEYGTELQAQIDSNATNIHIDLDLTATPLCQIDVIMDETTGDIIRAWGSGNLKIKTGLVEETEMRGRYQIERGSYNFSFQTLIKKPFELEGGENSYIEWNGDPYEANLNVGARYIAQNVSLRDLMTSDQGSSLLDQSAQNYKGDVFVNARLTGLLSKPDISFAINFPQGSPMQNNVSAQQLLRQIAIDKSEMLRQVTYLIVFKSFAPYKVGIGARNPGADLAVNTISDLLSGQMGKILTNILQQITGDRSLNIDFSTEVYNSNALTGGGLPGVAGYDRVNFNFMLNKSYYNNRVVVNLGSDFDMNVRNTTATGFQFLPDVSVEFILTNNRRLRAIMFKKDALDFAGRRNRAGVSLSYRKEFDKLFSSNREEALIFVKKDDQ